MSFTSFIAKRYFFAKSKWNVVNIISLSASLVLVLATSSFFIVLSVFSGLKDFGTSYTKAFDPDIKVFSKSKKFFVYSNVHLPRMFPKLQKFQYLQKFSYS